MKEIPITSFDNLQIGQAENAAAGTGCTVVLLGKDGAPAGLDVRGGGPASRESELLKPPAAAQVIHAIVLAGGSAFGLDAAGGVMRYLEERNIGYDVGVTKVPLVCQADLFDLTVADARTRPDAPWRTKPVPMPRTAATIATATMVQAPARLWASYWAWITA